jgi:hypothetical protein
LLLLHSNSTCLFLRIDGAYIPAFTDIKSWFQRNTSIKYVESASSVDFQRAEKLMDFAIPRALKSILTEANGGLWVMDKELLSLDKMADILSQVQSSSLWNSSLLPFAGDEGGMLVLDTRNDSVCEWDRDDGLGDVIAHSLGAFLENYRDSLLEGHCEFLDDVGVVEKVSKSRK